MVTWKGLPAWLALVQQQLQQQHAVPFACHRNSAIPTVILGDSDRIHFAFHPEIDDMYVRNVRGLLPHPRQDR
jgi:hypothetical protein